MDTIVCGRLFYYFFAFPWPPRGNPLPSVLLPFGSFSLIDCENNVLCCAAATQRVRPGDRERERRGRGPKLFGMCLKCCSVITSFTVLRIRHPLPTGPLHISPYPKALFPCIVSLLRANLFTILNGVSKVLLGEGLNAWVISSSLALFHFFGCCCCCCFIFCFVSSFIPHSRATLCILCLCWSCLLCF